MPTTFRNTVDSTDLNVALGGGTPPATGDTVILDRFETNFSTNISKPAVDLALLHMTRTFRGNFKDGYLNIQAALMKLEFGGDRLKISSDSGAGTIDKILWDPEKGSAWLELMEMVAPEFRGSRGTVLVGDSVDAGNFYFSGDVRGTLVKSALGADLVDVRGNARVRSERSFTAAKVAGGEFVVDEVAAAAGDVTVEGGTYKLGSVASHGFLKAYSGVIDASGLNYNLTISTGEIGPDVLVIEPATGVTFTYSGLTRLGREPNKRRG